MSDTTTQNAIQIFGANEHNLKNIDLKFQETSLLLSLASVVVVNRLAFAQYTQKDKKDTSKLFRPMPGSF